MLLMERTFHRREFGWLLLVTASLLWAVPLWNAEKINAWSLTFARPALVQGLGSVLVSEPPARHQRGAVWMAQAALARGDAEGTSTLLFSLSRRNDMLLTQRILGDIYWHKSDLYGAISIWSAINDLQSLLRAAIVETKRGKFADAFRLYEAAYAINGEYATLPYVLFLQQWEHNPELAISLLQKSLSAYPESAFRYSWLLHLGDAQRKAKCWDEAINTYRLLLGQFPANKQAHIGLGWVYYEGTGNVGQALAEFYRATKLPPYNGEGFHAIGLLNIRERRYDDAIGNYQKAIALNPNGKWLYIELGNTERLIENFEQAVNTYGTVIQRYPHWAPAYYELSWAYYLQGEFSLAENAITVAIQYMQPASAAYYNRAGKIFDANNKRAQAQWAYQRVLEIDPADQTAINWLEHNAGER